MHRILNARTPAGDALRAVSLDGVEALSELFEFRVGFNSADRDLDCQALIGEPCALELELPGGAVRHLHGNMVRFGQTGRAGAHWTYEALLRPRLWHASRRSDCRIWQNRTVPDIVQAVLGDNGVVFESRLKARYRSWVYLTQYRETDLNFIGRLMEHEGIYYWFEHHADRHVMVLGDHFSTHEPFPGYETVPFFPPDHAWPDQDHFHGWRLAREVETGRYAHADYDFTRPAADLLTESADPRGHLYDHYEIYDFPGGYTAPADGQRYAELRLEALQAEQDRVFGHGRVRGAAPGRRLTLERHPRSDQNRELLVVRAHYHFANNGYEGAAAGEAAGVAVAVEAQPARSQFRPRRATPKPHTLGPETAVVVGPPGEEIHTDEYGRIKVRFHWDRRAPRDGTDSCWIRVSHPWAGLNFGGIHVPRVGQEVVVDFLNGDPDQPLVTGRVYNAHQMPPWALPASKTQSGFLTRSSPGGSPDHANAIRFEDAKGAEQLWLHAERDQLSEVEHDEDKWVGHDRRKTVDRDETTVVHRHRTETVDGDETITVHGQRTETVDRDETITIHHNRTERVDRNETIGVGRDRRLTVDGTASLTVRKSRNKTVDRNETARIGQNKTETVGMTDMQNVGIAKMVSVGAAYSVNIGMVMNTLVGMNQSAQIGKDKTTTVGGQYRLAAGGGSASGGHSTLTMTGAGVKLDGKTLEFAADDELVLRCGSSTVRLTPGLIEILATLAKINC